MRKADAYLPTEVGQTIRVRPPPDHPASPAPIPSIDVTLLTQVNVPKAGCVHSTLRLRLVHEAPQGQQQIPSSDSSSTFYVNHLYFSEWPDYGVPEAHDEILNLVLLTDLLNSSDSPPGGPNWAAGRPEPDGRFPPILCHCSAGIGRTGTFIALSSILRSLNLLSSHSNLLPSPSSQGPDLQQPFQPPPPSPLGPLPNDVSQDAIAVEIDGLREQRMGMLQRPEQIEFVYSSVAAAIIRNLRGTRAK